MKLSNMKKLSKKYNFFLFDQWGVLHDGNKIFKFTNKTIEKIKKKNLILISNTSQTVSEFKLQTLKKLKLNYIHFNKIVTAGEALINISNKLKSSRISNIIKNKKAYIISNNNEKQLVKKLHIKKVNYLNCKFILSLSLNPIKNFNNIISKLEFLSKKKIPMICTNPDIYTFNKGSRLYQIGFLAKKYSDLGGKVYYIGKPYKDIFNNLVKKKDKKKTIIVGDNLDTDILGGKKYKIKTALALDGYKKLNLIKSDNLAIKEILKNKIKPDYIIKDISIS